MHMVFLCFNWLYGHQQWNSLYTSYIVASLYVEQAYDLTDVRQYSNELLTDTSKVDNHLTTPKRSKMRGAMCIKLA